MGPPEGGFAMRVRRSALLPLALVVALVPATWAGAQAKNFGTHLSGDEEVPARDTLAQGQATFQVNDDGTVGYRLIVANIHNVFAAHIHCGAVGVNGPIIVPLYDAPPGGGRIQGPIIEDRFDPTGIMCAGMPLLEAIEAGATYVNVHTNDGVAPPNTGPGDFPGGEVRGQL
jgi:hypothetical protein